MLCPKCCFECSIILTWRSGVKCCLCVVSVPSCGVKCGVSSAVFHLYMKLNRASSVTYIFIFVFHSLNLSMECGVFYPECCNLPMVRCVVCGSAVFVPGARSVVL